MAMTRLQFLLTKLTEECSEVAQITLKTQQFGFNDSHPKAPGSNKERLHQELNDLLAIVDMLNEECGLDFKPSSVVKLAKISKINHYYNYSKSLGLVED